MSQLFKFRLHLIQTCLEIHNVDNVMLRMNNRDTSLKSNVVRKIWDNGCPSNSSNYCHQQIIFLNVSSFIFLLELKISQISWIIKVDDIIMYIL